MLIAECRFRQELPDDYGSTMVREWVYRLIGGLCFIMYHIQRHHLHVASFSSIPGFSHAAVSKMFEVQCLDVRTRFGFPNRVIGVLEG